MLITGVVMALGITEIISGWGRVIRSNATIALDWLHAAWTICFLFGFLGYWIGMWAYVDIPLVHVSQSLFLVLPTLLMVLVAFAITPTIPSEGKFDIRDYYMRKRVPIFITAAFAGLFSFLADFVIAGQTLPLELLLFPSLAVAPAFTQRVWVHVLSLSTYILFVVATYSQTIDEMATRFVS